MNKTILFLGAALMATLLAGPALADEHKKMKTPEAMADQVVDSFVTGCEKELETFCKDVTPGEGRLLACLYAHGDKVSGRCEYAVYDAAAQLERYLNAVTYVVNECRDDLEKYCADVEPGKGRLAKCLERNESKITKRCKQALKDVK